ncbi:hypothetical protein HMI55_004135 [Coelomomyces lativittatus]|nr:hypothetical protein HMI55_004135 [Coelomomyces lativittatus]
MVDSLLPSKKIQAYLSSNPTNLDSVLHQAFHETLPVPIAVGTLTQLVLDLHFLLKKAPNLSTEATTLAQGLCERVFKLYLQNGGQPSSLKDGRWYEQRALEIEKN